MGDQEKFKLATPGSTGLMLKEETIFERSSPERRGYELPPLSVPVQKPTRYKRQSPAELPEVSELDVVRHFTRLSSWNYSIDAGILPLGSCTMKYNPRINEELVALPGLANLHPDIPIELAQGALEIIWRVEKMLCQISGMDECSVQPAAGAHGEFTGLLLVRAFHEKHESSRKYILIPDNAHGTNPASCVLAGYEAITIPSSEKGIVALETVAKLVETHKHDLAAMMVTNPNTVGLFEANISEIAELLHSVGAQLFMDGANMNAIMGVAKPKDMGVDVMQFNLHKTFSTPHGGGGPGSGPVAVRSHLAPYLPNPRVRLNDGQYLFEDLRESVGKVKGAYGNFGVVVRALCYLLRQGSDGLKEATQRAVLNANYLRAELSRLYQLAYSEPHFHECVLSDALQTKSKGVNTLQIAKALIDKGFHPPTIYFPLVVSGAMLIEPTETESIQDIDRLIQGFVEIAGDIESGEDTFEDAPRKSFVNKVDETRAARKPVLSLDDRTSG